MLDHAQHDTGKAAAFDEQCEGHGGRCDGQVGVRDVHILARYRTRDVGNDGSIADLMPRRWFAPSGSGSVLAGRVVPNDVMQMKLSIDEPLRSQSIALGWLKRGPH